jgi:hypothetical protein
MNPALDGHYVCADYVSGRLFDFSASTTSTSTLAMVSSGLSNINPSAFGEDVTGELYLVDYSVGGFYRLTVMGGM